MKKKNKYYQTETTTENLNNFSIKIRCEQSNEVF